MPLLLLAAALLLHGCADADARSEVPSPEQQVTAAKAPLPEPMQEQARVLGYTAEGELVELRDGQGYVCLADDPHNEEEFHVACYVEALEPFMERGRALREEGLSGDEIREVRREEIAAGDLDLPEGPSALYSLSGPADAFDYEEGVLRQARALHVVYIPYATGEETGLPTRPVGAGVPWLMDEGEPWAHIMYSTGQEIGQDVQG